MIRLFTDYFWLWVLGAAALGFFFFEGRNRPEPTRRRRAELGRELYGYEYPRSHRAGLLVLIAMIGLGPVLLFVSSVLIRPDPISFILPVLIALMMYPTLRAHRTDLRRAKARLVVGTEGVGWCAGEDCFELVLWNEFWRIEKKGTEKLRFLDRSSRVRIEVSPNARDAATIRDAVAGARAARAGADGEHLYGT